MKKKLTLLSATLALTFATSTFADQITAWVIDGKNEVPFFQQLESKFNEKYKDENVNVRIEAIPGINDAIQAAWMSKDLPDVIFVDGPNMANYVWSGMLKPMDNLLSKDVKEHMIKGLIDQGTYTPDGQIYMLGMGDSSVLLWGNKKYLDQIGARIPTSPEDAWTYDEFKGYLAKLKKLDGIKWPLSINAGMAGEWMTYGFYPLVVSNGGNILDSKTHRAEGTINSKDTIEALTRLQTLVKDGYVVPKSAGANRFYGDKSAALEWVGNWMLGTFSEALGDDLVLIPAPKFGTQAYSPNGGWGWAVPSTTKDDEDVSKFLNFALSKDQVTQWASLTGYIPGRSDSIKEVPSFAEGGKAHMLALQAQKIALVRPIHPGYPVLTKEFGKAVEHIINGADAKSALDKAARTIDNDIEDNDGYPPFDK